MTTSESRAVFDDLSQVVCDESDHIMQLVFLVCSTHDLFEILALLGSSGSLAKFGLFISRWCFIFGKTGKIANIFIVFVNLTKRPELDLIGSGAVSCISCWGNSGRQRASLLRVNQLL